MRTAHETVGKLVSQCEAQGRRLADLTLGELQRACTAIGEDVCGILGVRNAAAALASYGSGGPARVAEQVERWRRAVGLGQ